jgi:adenylate cyclase
MSRDPLLDWLLAEAPSLPSCREVVAGLVERLNGEGFTLNRIALGMGVLHPDMLAATFSWTRGDRFVTRSDVRHGVELTSTYLESPFKALDDEGDVLRRRLTGPAAELDFPMLEELCDAGCTDYMAMALPRSDGGLFRLSLATDRETGFSDEEISRLTALRPALGVVIELHARAEMTRSLLDLYLGPEAGRRVYRGAIKRGDGNTIRSVLWMCDLRGFTTLSDRISLDFLIAVLNDYFEAVTGPVHAHGGKVLKYIGDAVLGIFRIDRDEEVEEICQRALDAADLARANMRLLNRRRGREGKPALDFGIALHIGDAMYGNVGAHDRLDFTVIGPAVNKCARLETLAGELGERIVCSAEFAEAAPVDMESLGTHSLKNIDGAVEAFRPA